MGPSTLGRREPGWQRWAGLAIAALYFLVLVALSRGFRYDYWDGVLTLTNSLYAAGVIPAPVRVTATRPLLDWLILIPVAGPAYHWWGPEAALRASQILMCLLNAGLLWACHGIYRRLLPPRIALATTVLLAVNPLVLSYAPFLLFDLFGALAALPFLILAFRYMERRTWMSYGALFGAYLLAVLSRYQLAILILIPLAYDLAAPGPWRERLKRQARSLVWLLPAAAYASAFLVTTLAVAFFTSRSLLTAAGDVQTEFSRVFSYNLRPRVGNASPLLYLTSLLRQMGPGVLLAGLGVWGWVRRRKALDLYLAVATLTTLTVLSFGISTRETRYLLTFLPLVYAALGKGLEILTARPEGRRRAVRWAVGGLLAAAMPWGTTLAAGRWVRSEPAFFTSMPSRLGSLLKGAVRPGDCVGWFSGEIVIPFLAQPPVDKTYPLVAMGASLLPAFAGRYVGTPEPDPEPGSGCRRFTMLVEPREAQMSNSETYRPGAPPLAKVYDWPSRRLRWEIFPLEVRAAGR